MSQSQCQAVDQRQDSDAISPLDSDNLMFQADGTRIDTVYNWSIFPRWSYEQDSITNDGAWGWDRNQVSHFGW